MNYKVNGKEEMPGKIWLGMNSPGTEKTLDLTEGALYSKNEPDLIYWGRLLLDDKIF